jgi:hypothetical protein
MKYRTIMAIVLFMVLSTAGVTAEAIVLPAGTTIVFPDATPNIDITEAQFLLTREDMEAAVLAQETVKIREDQISKLNATIVETQREFRIMGVGLVVLPILAIVFYALVAK